MGGATRWAVPQRKLMQPVANDFAICDIPFSACRFASNLAFTFDNKKGVRQSRDAPTCGVMKYIANNNVVYSCRYHVVWCPKYRRSVLRNGVDERLKEIIQQVVDQYLAEGKMD